VDDHNARGVTDVLVIGAGPTGLLLAIVLTRCGVRVTIVDRKPGPTRESRAVVLQARTMEIYAQLGIAERMTAASADVRLVAPGFGRRRFGVVPVGAIGVGLTPFPRLTVLEQSKTESILAGYLAELGVRVGWNATVELPSELPASHDVTVRSPEGTRVIGARYVVGADGVNSIVRRALGIEFEGSTSEHTFFVCDADDVRGLTTDAVNVRLGNAEFLLGFPLPAEGATDHQRIIGLLPPGGGGEIVEPSARAAVARAFGVEWGDSRWFSTYRVQHRVATVFRRGAYFLAGDAGHVHSPVGAQGMNTGLQDAHNLALKLVDVIAGRAPESYLDRYEAERQPVAVRLIASTDRVFGLATSSRRRDRMVRRWLAPILAPAFIQVLPHLPGASRLFGYVSQTRIHYWMDAEDKLRSGGYRDPVVGRRLPWTGDNHDALRTFDWQVHGYGGTDAGPAGAGLSLSAHSFPSTARTPLRGGTLYLVRPDGFVAAKAAPADAVRVFARAVPWATAAPAAGPSRH
jgi:2-polyprenyl-6-methoxyphenol hydroxylase-like FAD-dependent oxidoreductase